MKYGNVNLYLSKIFPQLRVENKYLYHETWTTIITKEFFKGYIKV